LFPKATLGRDLSGGREEALVSRHVAVTGGSGKLGRAVVDELAAHGWLVHSFDVVAPLSLPEGASFTRIDLTDLGQVVEAFHGIDELHSGVDAVVHLAAIPGATHAANSHTFVNNISSTFHVFTAAGIAGVSRVVWASSETLLGYPFATAPVYVPLDEDLPAQGNVAYSQAKVCEEELARQLARLNASRTFVGLRFSNVMEPDDYRAFPEFERDVRTRKWNLWGYIDARDAAAATRLALDADVSGASVYNIAAADTVLSRPSLDALEEVFPGTPVRGDVSGTRSLISTQRAKTVLGFEPVHRWRDELPRDA
jgi:nucleoside-diphosphate-sugar epimerase